MPKNPLSPSAKDHHGIGSSLRSSKDDSKLSDTYTPGRIRASKMRQQYNDDEDDEDNLDAIDIRIENKS